MADDPRHLLRCELTQLERSRVYLPPQLSGSIDEAIANRKSELTMIELMDHGRRAALVRLSAARGGGDWRNRTRGLASALAPTTAQHYLRRRGTW